MKAHLRVKGWGEHQHYKSGRNMVWIKVYVRLLDDPEYAMLPDATKAHLLAIWLLAARYQNSIPADLAFCESRMNAITPVSWDTLLTGGWVVPYGITASELLAKCLPRVYKEEDILLKDIPADKPPEPKLRDPKKPLTPDQARLKPYWVAYKATLGQPNAGLLRKTMFPIEDEVGPERALRVLENWMASADVKYGGLGAMGLKWRTYDREPLRIIDEYGGINEAAALAALREMR